MRAVATLDNVRAWRAQAHGVHIDEKLKRYIVELVAMTRDARDVIVRSRSGAVLHGCRTDRLWRQPARDARARIPCRVARALLDGRDFAFPDDVRAVAPHALRHRIGFNYRLAVEGIGVDRVIDALVAAVPAP